MKVAVVAEYYPRPTHPGLGIWAHRQARAARELGVDVRVLVLERPLPPMIAFRSLVPRRGRPNVAPMREWVRTVWDPPRDMVLDGVPVRYVRYVSPPRSMSYASWGWWAARAVGRALDELRRSWPFELVHAHYAVPAGDAVLRWIGRRGPIPLAVSVHGGDLYYTASRSDRGRDAVSRVLGAADAVLANSTSTRAGVEQLVSNGGHVQVVHPGADAVPEPASRHVDPTLVTVAHLEAHKCQRDVIRALAALRARHPRLRYLLIGRGPDRPSLESLAESVGVREHVTFAGGLPHDRALAELAKCHVHVMPSRIDAFGVAHIEAMAAGLPTIGGAGTGAEDIAAAGEGALLVGPGDVTELVRTLDDLLSDDTRRERLGEQARRTVADHFSWRTTGERTVAIYNALSSRDG